MFNRPRRFLMIGILTIIGLSLTVCNGHAQPSEEETLKKGADLIRHDKFDEAITEFNKIIQTNPKSVNAYYNLGFAYDKKGDLARAISSFGKAIEMDAALTDAYYNRGFAYYKKGDFENAIADYNKVIEISPASADAYYGLGLVYSQKGDLDKAILEYTEAIKVRPNFALAYDARAVAYVTKKNYLLALADVNKAQSLGFRSRPLRRTPVDPAAIEKDQTKAPDKESSQRNHTQTTALKTAGMIFLLVSFLHLLRSILKVRVTIGRFIVPIWISVAGSAALLFLSLWIFKSAG